MAKIRKRRQRGVARGRRGGTDEQAGVRLGSDRWRQRGEARQRECIGMLDRRKGRGGKLCAMFKRCTLQVHVRATHMPAPRRHNRTGARRAPEACVCQVNRFTSVRWSVLFLSGRCHMYQYSWIQIYFIDKKCKSAYPVMSPREYMYAI